MVIGKGLSATRSGALQAFREGSGEFSRRACMKEGEDFGGCLVWW